MKNILSLSFFLFLLNSCNTNYYKRSEVLYPWIKIELGYSRKQVEDLLVIDDASANIVPDEPMYNSGWYKGPGIYSDSAYISCEYKHGILWHFSYIVPFNDEAFDHLKKMLNNKNMDKHIIDSEYSIMSYDFDSYMYSSIYRNKNDKYEYYYPDKEIIIVNTRYMFNSELQSFGLPEEKWLD